jgi:hypothetical protein
VCEPTLLFVWKSPAKPDSQNYEGFTACLKFATPLNLKAADRFISRRFLSEQRLSPIVRHHNWVRLNFAYEAAIQNDKEENPFSKTNQSAAGHFAADPIRSGEREFHRRRSNCAFDQPEQGLLARSRYHQARSAPVLYRCCARDSAAPLGPGHDLDPVKGANWGQMLEAATVVHDA